MKTLPLLMVCMAFGFFAFSQADRFKPSKKVVIGLGQEYESLGDFLKTKPSDVHIIIEEGTYIVDEDLTVSGTNIIIEGKGTVNLYCKTLYDNVMWIISSSNIVLINLHMKHFIPGDPDNQNCTGRVLAFDNADKVSVINCNLNGCGLAGLHDNLGNSNILIKDCYIHNNSLGAYTNIEGGIWLEETDDHPVFKFENNRMENNGPDRIPE